MIAFAKENQTQQQTDKDVVCPKCFKPLPKLSYTLFPIKKDRHERKLRTYFCWCNECKIGSETIQFERDGRWVIHKYQIYGVSIKQLYCTTTGKWIVLNELPELAPVIVGPGGNYDKQIIPDVTAILKNLQSIFETASQTIKNLLKITELKK